MIKMMSFKWTENSTTNYINAVESPEIQSLLHSFQTQAYPKKNSASIRNRDAAINRFYYKPRFKTSRLINRKGSAKQSVSVARNGTEKRERERDIQRE